ncbi:MAG TPA: hypothetical protein VL049_16080 [Candidatus Dormibacteraeota bacterium]|nr:hypothetical protein [Candidatus Dormibacteraeota bacterium]
MRRRTRALWAASLLLAAGCAASGAFTHSRATLTGMPCAEADRVARAALLRLGYDGDVVTPAQPGAPGQVAGHKAGGYDYVTNAATRQYTATVAITCSNAGATLDATTDEPLPGSLTFKSDFASAADAVAARRIQRPRLASRPESGVVIAIEPLRGSDARTALGVDLPAAGVTPVRLTIDNRTERTYAFAATGVRLESQEGERTAPLTAAEVGTRAGAGAQQAATEHAIADAAIAPHAAIKGFLFVPASAYRRATVVLIDQETEEEEGFSVEF